MFWQCFVSGIVTKFYISYLAKVSKLTSTTPEITEKLGFLMTETKDRSWLNRANTQRSLRSTLDDSFDGYRSWGLYGFNSLSRRGAFKERLLDIVIGWVFKQNSQKITVKEFQFVIASQDFWIMTCSSLAKKVHDVLKC